MREPDPPSGSAVIRRLVEVGGGWWRLVEVVEVT
jgi:hypothetical protein